MARYVPTGYMPIGVDFGTLTVIEVLGMLEMAKLQVYEQALGLMDGDE